MFCTQCKAEFFLVVEEFFVNEILHWVIQSVYPVGPVDLVDPVSTQSPPKLTSICRHPFKHRLRVLVESRLSVWEQENEQ